ncbi:MAG: FKBP-type peptidyl-prolyl cis-trans isomerase N-terminal domain-containing protein, partial [Candidatus Angelobacter sp.]
MKQHRLAAAVALVSLVLAGCDSQTSVELKTPAQKASYGIGLNMGKSLAQEGMDDLDSKAVAQGIEDAVGKKEQKLKDDELVEAFAALQKRAEERMAKMSEESATAGKKFLEENAKKDGVVTTASGLQYKIVKKADGAQPKPTDVVTVHY